MTHNLTPGPLTPRPGGFFGRTKAYFGFAEPGLTWRQRLGIFHANERRSWARLLGSRRPEDSCNPNSAPPTS